VLSTDVSFPPGEQGVVLIANVTRPSAVFLNGKPVRERIDVEQWNEPGWRYDAGNAYLAVRVTQDGATKVRADGVIFREVRRLPWLAKKIDFQFNDSLDGWLPVHDISEAVPVQGSLFGRVSGPDPYLVRRLVHVQGDDCPVLHLNMRVTAGSGGQIFWTTESSPDFGEDKSVRFAIIPDGHFHEYRLELRQDPRWAGQIVTGLRLDPCGGARAGEFNVDYLRAQLPSVLAPKKGPRAKE
jgi:hypothetical protein